MKFLLKTHFRGPKLAIEKHKNTYRKPVNTGFFDLFFIQAYCFICQVYPFEYWNLHGIKFSICTAKTQYQKIETNIPRKLIARPQSQFLHSCERFIYSHDGPAYSAVGKYVNWSWEYINRSQTHECGNWDWCRAIPFLGIQYINGIFVAVRHAVWFHTDSVR